MATEQADGRVRRSVHLDADMARWVSEQAAAESTSENTIIRRAVRLLMDTQAARRREPVEAGR